jgi:hypothetical protein
VGPHQTLLQSINTSRGHLPSRHSG